MRPALLLLAAAACFAQVNTRNTPAASVPASAAPIVVRSSIRIAPAALVNLENQFDVKMAGIAAGGDPIDRLGLTRGVYLNGYGVVFMAEIGLVVTPRITPFNQVITDAQKKRVYETKTARLPLLEKAMTESLRIMAATLSALPEDQQVVLAVRLDYLPWEDTTALPGVVIAKADRRSASMGNIQIEEQ